jgi:hypothetical protein
MSTNADAGLAFEPRVRPVLPPCDCTAYCGDDPALARGTVARCAMWERVHSDPQTDLVLARSEAQDYRRQRDDCLAALREIYRDFGECSRIAELCEPLISEAQSAKSDLIADAARYRFLRGDGGQTSVRWPRWEVRHFEGSWTPMHGQAMDTAIDAAIACDKRWLG